LQVRNLQPSTFYFQTFQPFLMPHYNITLLGFGNVGQALARLLMKKRPIIQDQYGITFAVTGIATGRRGAWCDSAGVDLVAALDLIEAGQPLSRTATPPIDEFLRAAQAQVVCESIPVNYESGQPALDYLRTALGMGIHAISANKGPVVHGYRELTELASAHGVHYFFESAVMDGAPIFSLIRQTLPAAEIRAFSGILNSTTNLVLERMEAGESFEDAVTYTQTIGLAETNPMGDLDGWDAAVKVAALCTVVLGIPTTPLQVDRTGILGITPLEIAQASQQGKRWKLVCSARCSENAMQAKVSPMMIGPESPFYSVNGSSSIVTFETDVLPALSIVEGNPSPETTAYGMLADFLNAVRHHG
jgi:homoserine dehydrogenase